MAALLIYGEVVQQHVAQQWQRRDSRMQYARGLHKTKTAAFATCVREGRWVIRVWRSHEEIL